MRYRRGPAAPRGGGEISLTNERNGLYFLCLVCLGPGPLMRNALEAFQFGAAWLRRRPYEGSGHPAQSQQI